MEIVNIEKTNLYIFWTTWGISMKFSETMWLRIILTSQNAELHPLSLEKPQGEAKSILPPPILRLSLTLCSSNSLLQAFFPLVEKIKDISAKQGGFVTLWLCVFCYLWFSEILHFR